MQKAIEYSPVISFSTNKIHFRASPYQRKCDSLYCICWNSHRSCNCSPNNWTRFRRHRHFFTIKVFKRATLRKKYQFESVKCGYKYRRDKTKYKISFRRSCAVRGIFVEQEERNGKYEKKREVMKTKARSGQQTQPSRGEQLEEKKSGMQWYRWTN